MNRRWAVVFVALVLLVAAGFLAWRSLAGRTGENGAAGVGEESEANTATADPALGQLYFPGAGGRLYAEPRDLPPLVDLPARISRVVEELLAGPSESGRFRLLPEGVALAGVHVSVDGIAYVDLASADLPAPPASGSTEERLAVYGLVNSILVNAPELRGVVLLWNGQQRATFSGHLDTTRPLTTDRTLIASRP